jgi:hypothetical protein
MNTILSLLDQRLPRVPSADLDAWRQHARAGDTVSQYRVGRSLLDAGLHSNLAEGRIWLWASAKQGFAPGQYLLGRLAREGLLPGARPGASIWWSARAIASWLKSPGGSELALRDRLRPRARSAKQLRLGERTKLRYMGVGNRPGLCAVELGQTRDGRIAVMFQSLPEGNTGTSVTNMAESVAFRALVELLLDGYDPDPQDLAWLEVWPQTQWTTGHAHALALTWDAHAERYRDPVWSHVDRSELPFDVDHALILQRAVA